MEDNIIGENLKREGCKQICELGPFNNNKEARVCKQQTSLSSFGWQLWPESSRRSFDYTKHDHMTYRVFRINEMRWSE